MNLAARLRSPWIRFLLLAAVSAAVWGPTVTYDFVWDDAAFVEHLPSIRSLSNIPAMFTELDAQAVGAEDYKVFRPLRNAVYALLYRIVGADEPQPWIYHLNNVIWHTAASGLLCLFVSGLVRRSDPDGDPETAAAAGLLAGLFFAVHPAVSETVCWVKGLDDIMAAAFCFGAGALLVRNQGFGATAAAALLYVAALYSKVSALPFCMMIPVLGLRGGPVRDTWRNVIVRTLAFGGLGVLYLLHRHLVIGQSHQIAPISGSYGQTLIDMLPVATAYTRLMLGIPPFFVDYSYLPGGHGLFSGPVLLGTGLLALWIIAGAWALSTPRFRPVGIAAVWTGLFLLPVSNLVPMMQYMAERFLYLPLAGFLTALSVLGVTLIPRRILAASALGLCLVWGATAMHRSTIWKDNLELFVRSATEGPRTDRVEANAVRAVFGMPHMMRLLDLGGELQILRSGEAQDWARQEQTLNMMTELFPGNSELLTARAILQGRRGDADGAERWFREALKANAADAQARALLGQLYLDQGRDRMAEEAISQAWSESPRDLTVLAVRAGFLWDQDRKEEARTLYRDILSLQPGNPVARQRSNPEHRPDHPSPRRFERSK